VTRAEIEQVRQQIEHAQREGDYAKASELQYGRLPELERRKATCRAAAAMLPQCIQSTVGVTRAEEFERTEHAIVRAAHEAGASIIAMGTHGRGRSLHLFLGSVALGTVERSDLPVILCGQ